MTEDKQKNQQDRTTASDKPRGVRSAAELAAKSRSLDLDLKEALIPPIGHRIYVILQTVKGEWKRLVFQVSHRYPAKARFTCELLGWKDEPRPEAAQVVPRKPGDPITLDVHDGVIGAGSKFNR